MKYLITGGLGFIGSNLSRLISKKKSNQVLVIDSLIILKQKFFTRIKSPKIT